MMNSNNRYIPQFTNEIIQSVVEKLSPQTSRACNNNMLWSDSSIPYSGDYYGYSLKRSALKNAIFDGAKFDHTSFTGSSLSNVQFHNLKKFESVYLEQSTLTDIIFQDDLHIENCNFSDSYLKNITFSHDELRGVYFNNCYLEGCVFDHCVIRATMFDGAYLKNCRFIHCNMRNLNIEFATMYDCDLTDSEISYFQFPYIIGVFGETNQIQNVFLARDGILLPYNEFKNNVKESIIYFTSLSEFFPLANLYYSDNKIEIAYNCIMEGIDIALTKNDIRSIENLCKLGRYHSMLSMTEIQTILKKIDKSIEKQKDNDIYSMLLSKSYHLRGDIVRDNSVSKLEIIINTSLKDNDIPEAGEFCQDIDSIIKFVMPSKISTYYQINHNSPIQICLTCIGLVADLMGIAGFITAYIEKRAGNEEMPENIRQYIKKSNEIFIGNLNIAFDEFEKLLALTTKKDQKNIVEDFRAKIIDATSKQMDNDFNLLISQPFQE